MSSEQRREKWPFYGSLSLPAASWLLRALWPPPPAPREGTCQAAHPSWPRSPPAGADDTRIPHRGGVGTAEGERSPALLHVITHLHACTGRTCDHRHSGIVPLGGHAFSWMQNICLPYHSMFHQTQQGSSKRLRAWQRAQTVLDPTCTGPDTLGPALTPSPSLPCTHTGSPLASSSCSLPRFPQACVSVSE